MKPSGEITRKKSSKYATYPIDRFLTNSGRKFVTQQRSKDEAHQKQLETVREEAKSAVKAIHDEHGAKEAELQRQLDYVRKTTEAEVVRIQRRSEAEKADLRATISRLEVDLMKARSLLQFINSTQMY